MSQKGAPGPDQMYDRLRDRFAAAGFADLQDAPATLVGCRRAKEPDRWRAIFRVDLADGPRCIKVFGPATDIPTMRYEYQMQARAAEVLADNPVIRVPHPLHFFPRRNAVLMNWLDGTDGRALLQQRPRRAHLLDLLTGAGAALRVLHEAFPVTSVTYVGADESADLPEAPPTLRPELDALRAHWLAAGTLKIEGRQLHGDAHLGNMLFGAARTGVVDFLNMQTGPALIDLDTLILDAELRLRTARPVFRKVTFLRRAAMIRAVEAGYGAALPTDHAATLIAATRIYRYLAPRIAEQPDRIGRKLHILRSYLRNRVQRLS